VNELSPPARTVIRVTGRDALGVLQRISSQQLETLAAGDARTTLFLDFRGRLLHRALVARTSDGAVWLLRDDAPAAGLIAHVDRHVFREELRMEDHSAAWRVDAEWSANDRPLAEADGLPVAAPEGQGFHLVLRPSGGADPAGPLAGERERILRGRPRHGHEIHEDFNPYEIGCGDEVHLSKGCYTGQEALQRLITYASVRRRPALVRGAGTPPDAPCDVPGSDGTSGRLTSVTASEERDTWIGIAILKKTALASADASAAAVRAASAIGIHTIEPFPERHPLGRDLG
jgi:folate-binding protein YgfZ